MASIKTLLIATKKWRVIYLVTWKYQVEQVFNQEQPLHMSWNTTLPTTSSRAQLSQTATLLSLIFPLLTVWHSRKAETISKSQQQQKLRSALTLSRWQRPRQRTAVRSKIACHLFFRLRTTRLNRRWKSVTFQAKTLCRHISSWKLICLQATLTLKRTSLISSETRKQTLPTSWKLLNSTLLWRTATAIYSSRQQAVTASIHSAQLLHRLTLQIWHLTLTEISTFQVCRRAAITGRKQLQLMAMHWKPKQT